MSGNIRLPNITGKTNDDKLSQIQSYLYKLVSDLNYALSIIDNSSSGYSQNIKVIKENSEGKSVNDAVNTFNSIKELIIKSADIVSSYSEQMKKTYNGLYVAQSDFGTYSQKTAQDIETNSKNISQIFSDIEQISNEIATEMQTNAWIRSGLLEESDGIPIYGIEVGQKTEINGDEIFNKFARFTADGIYFYLPGSNNAIAWLSGTTLYITHVEITGSLKMVKYLCDLSDGVTFMYIGD